MKLKFQDSKNNVVSITTGKLIPVELVSFGLIHAMVAEFGISKTAVAVQALYDADVLNEHEANAVLESLNEMILSDFARFGECNGNYQYAPLTLH